MLGLGLERGQRIVKIILLKKKIIKVFNQRKLKSYLKRIQIKRINKLLHINNN